MYDIVIPTRGKAVRGPMPEYCG